MPRRIRSTAQTNVIRPRKRAASTAETPTLPLTPIEVESIVQGAQASTAPPTDDASTRPTVVTYRPALGSSPIPTVEQAALAPAATLGVSASATPGVSASATPGVAASATPDVASSVTARVASAATPDVASAGAPDRATVAPSESRGPRRTREMFHPDAIRPPSRKR